MPLKIKKNKLLYLVAVLFSFTNGAMAAGISLPNNTGLPEASLLDIVRGLVMWMLGIFGFLAILSFIISGAMYFFSAGDDAAMKKAKNQMKWSIIGVIVGLMGYIIIYAIDKALRGGGLG